MATVGEKFPAAHDVPCGFVNLKGPNVSRVSSNQSGDDCHVIQLSSIFGSSDSGEHAAIAAC